MRRATGHLLVCLALATLACIVPTATPPTASAPTVAPVPPTPAAAATSEITAFGGEAVALDEQALPQSNPFAPFPAPGRVLTLPGSARGGDPLPKLQSVERLSAAQQETLLAQGFVITSQPFEGFAEVYAYGGEQKLPAFITSDAVLHASRILIDVAWQRSEAKVLFADLQGLCRGMVAASQAQWEMADDDATAQAALRNMAFFAVCSSLLDPADTPPAPVATITTDELTLIAERGRFLSPLFGRELDYAQFEPYGHYAQEEPLSRAFQTLRWLARPLSLDYATAGSGALLAQLQEARMAARQALLMLAALEASNNTSRWERLFQPGLYFYGAHVAWGLPQVRTASTAVFGRTPSLARLADEGGVDDFLATIHTLPTLLPFEPAPQRTFAFLAAPGAPAAQPDAPILRELVFNRVGAYMGEEPAPRTALQTGIGPIRGLPRTLDVAAVLGSQHAQEIVVNDGDADYDGYALQRETLQNYYADMDASAWVTSLNGAWLFSLQPLLSSVAGDGLLFAPAQAWQARELAAWHGAWMALRQQTELAPRPVTAVGVSPDVAYGYLEPQPLLYGRLASLTAQILEGLGSRNMLDAEIAGKLQQLQRLLEAAETIARKEAADERLTPDEALLLSQFMARLDDLTTFAPAASGGAALTARGPQRVVDVYQDPSSGSLLQAASGEIWPIYVLVPREEGVILTLGGVLSNYELHGEQIGATSWRDMESRPPPPAWLQDVVVEP